MKAIMPLCLSIMLCLTLSAQIELERQVIASSGGFHKDNSTGISVSWTMGETAIQTLENSNADIILTQGFQQPDEDSSVNTSEPIEELGLKIFPNPVSQTLNVQLEELPSEELRVKLLNVNGQILIEQSIKTKTLEIQMEGFPDAMYFLVFSNKTKKYTKKILKTKK